MENLNLNSKSKLNFPKNYFFNFIQNPFCFVIFFFLLGFVFRFVLSDFNKTIFIYPDELRYIHLAQNFTKGNGFLIYNLPTEFSKILYPLFLIPAFLFDSIFTQQKIITLIQSLLVSSVIFPTYLIAKRILQNKKYILFVSFLSLFMSDACFSLTFMSENVYYPFSLWAIYFFILLIEKENQSCTGLCVLIGVFCYILYLCKEIALVFPLSFFVYTFFKLIPPPRKQFIQQNILNVSIVFFSFLFCYILIELFVFQFGKNSYYNQTTIDILFEKNRFSYLFFSSFNYLMNVTVACLFYPLFLPILYFKKLTKQNQNIFLYLIILLLLSTLVLSYTIFIREDFFDLNDNPRALLRYIPFFYLPLLIIFISLFENQKNNNIFFNTKFVWILFFPILILFLFYKGPIDHSTIEQTMLQFLLNLDQIQQQNILILKIALLLGLFLFYYGLKFFPQKTLFLFFVFFILIQIENNKQSIQIYRHFYSFHQQEVQNLLVLKEFLKNNSHQTFLMAGANNTRAQHLSDMLLDVENLKSVHILNVIQNKNNNKNNLNLPVLGGSLVFSDIENQPFKMVYQLNQIDYLIVPQEFLPSLKINAKPLFDLSNEWLAVFENPNPQQLPMIEVIK